MKKVVGTQMLIALLFAFITPAYASIRMQAVIDQDIRVVFDFENMNSTVYWTIKNGSLITRTTIPEIIRENLAERDLTNVNFYTETIDFDSSTLSMRVAFSLSGSDIINIKVNTTTNTRTYNVRTDWRRFQVNITNGISLTLNFADYYGEPVEKWHRINYTLNDKVHPAYYSNFTGQSPFNPLGYFILSAEAKNLRPTGDTLIFDLPLSFEDSLLNSPFLIFGGLIVVIAAFSLYRKIRK